MRRAEVMAIARKRREKIDAMRRGGMTFAEIGERLGITRQRAHEIHIRRKKSESRTHVDPA